MKPLVVILILLSNIINCAYSQSSMDWNDMAIQAANENNLDKAMLCLSRAIELDGRNALAYSNRAEIKYKMSDYYGSIVDCNEAIRVANPDQHYEKSKSYETRGNCHYKIKEKVYACQDWSKAIELGFTEARQNILKFCQ